MSPPDHAKVEHLRGNPFASAREAVHAALRRDRIAERTAPLRPDEMPVEHRRAVFIDKDGTLVVDVPYNVEPALLRFTPNALEGLKLLDHAGYALVVVTNQPGLAAGRFSRAEFARLQRALVSRVRDEAGVELAGFYTCPHAPARGPASGCLCRKPAPGMLRQAARSHQVDLKQCWMVGDILDDIEAGHRAGCRSVLLDVGNETMWRLSPLREPEHRAADLLDAARFIVASDLAARAAVVDAAELQ
ncbi:MAG: HAD family hydrolase [Pseudomonadota bacterium]|nr:HAD family hydrolase [Pseudomonadota bacterium]